MLDDIVVVIKKILIGVIVALVPFVIYWVGLLILQGLL